MGNQVPAGSVTRPINRIFLGLVILYEEYERVALLQDFPSSTRLSPVTIRAPADWATAGARYDAVIARMRMSTILRRNCPFMIIPPA
jgi:hypothetical protein